MAGGGRIHKILGHLSGIAVQPRKEEVLGTSFSNLAVPKGNCGKAVEGLFRRVCSDRTRGKS